MKFVANENFPRPSIEFLRNNNIEIKSIAQLSPGITDEQVMNLAIQEGLIILTHDSDYGELIFKYGFKPQEGVIYFKLFDFQPADPGKMLLQLLEKDLTFKNSLTVIDEQ
jgi:predicted nuclease of predicted toxin-antitoxin system